MNLRRSIVIAAALVVATLGGRVDAGFTITIDQVGSNVVATGRGTIDTSDLYTGGESGQYPAFIEPGFGQLALGAFTDADTLNLYNVIIGQDFGPGGTMYAASSSGDYFDIVFGYPYYSIDLPLGYVSGTPLSDTATWDNATLASLGVTAGTYSWTFGSGADTDSITMIAGASVPEPSSLALIGLGMTSVLGCISLRRNRRQSP